MQPEDCETIEELEDGMWTPCGQCKEIYDFSDLREMGISGVFLCPTCYDDMIEPGLTTGWEE